MFSAETGAGCSALKVRPCIFAGLYVFNFKYQEEMASTFEFIQRWSLDFNTLKTSHLDSD